MWPKFHRWQQPSKNGNHVVKIAFFRNGFWQANEWPESLPTMQCIAGDLSLFVVFTPYFVSLVKKVRVCYNLIAVSCKMIHEMTNFLSAWEGWKLFDWSVGLIYKGHMHSANALMYISTWCMSLVGQWLFYSFFLFIRMSVHLTELHVYW